ncbi:MAG TPA: ABC transporter ATP-binding protein [Ktedonobacterales bacterium]
MADSSFSFDGAAEARAPSPTIPHALDADAAGASNGARAAANVPVIAVRELTKTYVMGTTHVRALRGVTLAVQRGEFVAVMGPSGSGKSTFMNLIGCLDRPTSGSYALMGIPVSRLSLDQLADVRNRRIGFVFQGFNLLARATALGNVALPLVYAGLTREEQERRARRALQLVGLGSRLHHQPSQLSGGQQQRVAIARALVNGPAVLLADEPTGNLDSRTSVEILALLQALNARGLTIVLVTHELDVAAYAQRQIGFHDGRVVRDEPVHDPRSARGEIERLMAAAAAAHPEPQSHPQPSVQIREESQP